MSDDFESCTARFRADLEADGVDWDEFLRTPLQPESAEEFKRIKAGVEECKAEFARIKERVATGKAEGAE